MPERREKDTILAEQSRTLAIKLLRRTDIRGSAAVANDLIGIAAYIEAAGAEADNA